jgi:hypothetical protein
MSIIKISVACFFILTASANAFQWGPGGASGFENFGNNMINNYEAGRRARMERELAEQQMEMMRDETARINAETERLKASKKAKFEANVLPKVERVHPDFKAIIAGTDYWKWANLQTAALEKAAKYSNDPADIIWAVSEFKKWCCPPPKEPGTKRQIFNGKEWVPFD